MTTRPFASILLLCAACGVVTSALASVDTSRQPGGVYMLKPGIYVAETANCEAPPNSVSRKYDGRGIVKLDDRACKLRLLTRKGNRYTVNQSCISVGANAVYRTERQQILVHDALTFTQIIRGREVQYRYCPADQLPDASRK